MAFLTRYRTWLILAASALAFYAVLGFVLVPYGVKAHGIPALSEKLRHPVFLGSMEFNPFTFTVKLTGFEIQQQDGTPMVGFQELFVNFEGTSVVRSAYLFDEIRLTLPFGLVRIQPDGTLNLLSLASPDAAPAEAPPAPPPGDEKARGRIPPIEIRELSIHQGVLEFWDESKRRPVTIDVVPIEITLRNFSTRQGGENAYAFTAELGREEVLSWEGTVLLDPLESQGRFSLSNLKLATLWPSLRDRFRFDITGGAMTVAGEYRFDTKAAPVNFQLTEGRFSLSDFRLGVPGDLDPLIAVPSLVVDHISVDLPKQQIGIGTVRVTEPHVRGWVEPDGSVNFSSLFAPVDDPTSKGAAEEASRSKPPPAEEAGRPWTVAVKEIGLEKGAIAFEDRSLKSPADLSVDDLRITLNDVQVPFKGAMPLAASLRLNQTGTVETKGRLHLDPVSVDLDLSLAHIGLRPFQPYLDGVVQLELTDGELELAGDVKYRSRHETEPMLRYAGKVAVNNLHVLHRDSNRELVGWTALGLNKVVLELEPTAVKIGEIQLRDPAVQVVTAPDGTMNVTRIMVEPDRGATTPKPTAAKAPASGSGPTPITIETVTLSKLSATFVDESIQPNVTTGIHDLSGTIKGLSSKQVAKADVSLAGRVDHVAPIKVQGKINPLSGDAYTDLKVLFQGIDLTAVSPYAGKYVGYPIAKGKLSLDLKYFLSQKQLVGENKVLVDQLTFGEKTDSSDATSLPVRLAVALLKDRRGRIDIDLPVRGDLNEPDFRYGRVVLNALVNLITKVATSPFAALGGLVGGSGEDLQYVEFVAGSHELDDAEHGKIATLAKALEERPALRLEIIGSADPIKDRDAMAREKIAAELQRRFTQGGKKNLQAALTKEREVELLGDLYAERLGKQATKSETLPGGKTVARVLSADEIREELVPVTTVEEEELRALARDRAKAIREDLVRQGKVLEDRVFLVEVELARSEKDQVRTRLNLTGG